MSFKLYTNLMATAGNSKETLKVNQFDEQRHLRFICWSFPHLRSYEILEVAKTPERTASDSKSGKLRNRHFWYWRCIWTEKRQEVRAKSIQVSSKKLLSWGILTPNENFSLTSAILTPLFNSTYQLVAVWRTGWGKMALAGRWYPMSLQASPLHLQIYKTENKEQ